MKVEVCPQCGAPAGVAAKACDFCKAEFFVSSVSYLGQFDKGGVDKYLSHYKGMVKGDPENGEAHFALGLCYLRVPEHPEHRFRSILNTDSGGS